MNRIISIFAAVLGLSASANSENEFSLDYDQAVILDAEELAETGIREAYEKLFPVLKKYIQNPAKVIENIDNNLPSYSVSCLGHTYQIYSPITSDSEGESWGRATYAIFEIINSQLIGVNIKFYAVNGGNDLSVCF
jgi:hypothetical protein